jgi:hypothetical protein
MCVKPPSRMLIDVTCGFDILDETVEVLTWRQLSLYDKPAVFSGKKDLDRNGSDLLGDVPGWRSQPA